jgi:hypothetical protein
MRSSRGPLFRRIMRKAFRGATETKASSVLIESERGSSFCFDAFSSREPIRSKTL